ncbi:MAG: lamin tail domain-containing protein [Candidatus Delongbacteria bacterium]
MKNRLMVLALVGLAGQTMASGVFISEYIEGSSNNKAVEIANVTGGPVSLANYQLWRGWNGGGWTSFTTLTGTLANNDVYVLANPSANAAILAVADITNSSIINWNGDDAVGLAEWDGAAFVLVDVIGTPSVDPGTGWMVNGTTTGTLDHTIIRNASVCDGETDWAVANLEYTVLANDTFTNLGSHVSACGAGNVPPAVSGISYLPQPVQAGDGLVFTANANDSDGTVSMVVLNYGPSAGNLSSSISMDPLGGGVYSNSAPITAPNACEQLFYQVVATDDDGDTGSSAVLSLTVFCELTIPQIQGGVAASPYVGQVVTTEGQVSVVQSATSMFIQDDNGPWHGIQVFGAHPGVLEGDLIRVTGTILEYNGFTEIAGSLTIQVLATPGPLTLVPQLLTVGQVLAEDYEGVLVRVENTTCVGSVDPNTYLYDGIDQILVYAPGFTGVEDACYNVTGVRYAYQGTPEIAIRTLADITECGVVEGRDELKTFALGQAYPNPFNPSAQITFSLDVTAEARLSVYNVIGQEVAVLVDGLLESGAHVVTFDAANLPSGLYFYNLQSAGRQLTGKMTLVR